MLNPTNVNNNEQKTIIFEKVTISLPKNVVDYYRMIAHFQDTTELNLIESDLMEKLSADLEGRLPQDWIEVLGLSEALKTEP